MRMFRYPTMKCAETSRDCYGTVAECEIFLAGLTQEQLDQIHENGSSAILELSEEQVALNSRVLELTNEDKETLLKDGYFELEVHANNTVCIGCGSETSFDDEGNPIHD